MKLLKLFQKTRDRIYHIEHFEPPPISSVFLMVLTAMIGVINIKVMVPNAPDDILFLPMGITFLFGVFHPRWVYLTQLLLIDLQAYGFAIYSSHPNMIRFNLALLVFTIFAVVLTETGKIFWNQAEHSNLLLRRLNNFVDALENVLFSQSRNISQHESAEQLLEMCMNRVVVSGAYLYTIELGKSPKVKFYTKAVSALATLKGSKLLEEGMLENSADMKELLSQLKDKEYIVVSLKNRNKYRFSKSIFESTDIVSLVMIGLKVNDYLSGIILMADDRDILDTNSLDQRVVSIIRSLGEIQLKQTLERSKLVSMEQNNVEFTKLTMLDTENLIHKSKDQH